MPDDTEHCQDESGSSVAGAARDPAAPFEHPANPPIKCVLSGVEGAEAMELLRTAKAMIVQHLNDTPQTQDWLTRYEKLALKQ